MDAGHGIELHWQARFVADISTNFLPSEPLELSSELVAKFPSLLVFISSTSILWGTELVLFNGFHNDLGLSTDAATTYFGRYPLNLLFTLLQRNHDLKIKDINNCPFHNELLSLPLPHQIAHRRGSKTPQGEPIKMSHPSIKWVRRLSRGCF